MTTLFIRRVLFKRLSFADGCVHSIQKCRLSDQHQSFDETMLEYLVCPLSKKPLRYDKVKNELVSESIGVAYPLINGIPNLVPQDGRMLKNDQPITNSIDNNQNEGT